MSNAHDRCRQEIEAHRASVRDALHHIAHLLTIRAVTHDASKLEEPQFSIFASLPRDTRVPFGSPEYEARLKLLGPALEHHYAVERHHPEHFADGINSMTLTDLVEMFVDWQVSFREHGSGSFAAMLEVNRRRYNIDDQLIQILHNSAIDPCVNHKNHNGTSNGKVAVLEADSA